MSKKLFKKLIKRASTSFPEGQDPQLLRGSYSEKQTHPSKAADTSVKPNGTVPSKERLSCPQNPSKRNNTMLKYVSFEGVKRHSALSTGAVLLLGLGALEVDGHVSNPTYNVPKESCVSPFAVSEPQVDHNASTLFQTWTGIDTTGIIATGTVPEGSYGVQVAFENPDQLGTDWNVSRMIKVNKAGRYALKMAIGSGQVEFGMRVVAHEGSEVCDAVPDTSFRHVGTGDYATAEGQLPWPQPVNAPVNSLLTLFN